MTAPLQHAASHGDNLPQGYKRTEVGVIPVEWEAMPIGYYFDFKNGLNKGKEYFGYGTPIVNYMDVYNFRSLHLKDIAGRVDVTNDELKAYEIKKGDVCFTRTSETVEEIGISSVILEDMPSTVFSGFVLRARPKNDELCDSYKKYCFSSAIVRKAIALKSTYTTRALTNGKQLSSVKIPVPPAKTEQKAIARALSDVDGLIAPLTALIAKKRAVKHATMQQLLTGKTRLAGFTGAWEVRRLGDVCNQFKTGKLDANAMKIDGEYRFYTCARDYYFIDYYAFDAEALLVSGNGANVGYIHYYKGKFNAYQRTYVLTEFSANIQFLKLYMERNLQERIRVEVNAGNTPYITMDTLTEMQVFLPQTIEEQTAIAAILTDMDTDITTLETRLAKTKALKTGMCQELLTGKTRLL
jgi:type I restriction enzyme S subunit